MAKINLKEVLKDFEGKEIDGTQQVAIQDPSKPTDILYKNSIPILVSVKTGEALTIKTIVVESLKAKLISDEKDAKTIERFKLLEKCHGKETTIEVEIEDLALIVSRVKEAYSHSPLIYGRAVAILNK